MAPGPPDGVSRAAPPDPTAVLTVLAAAGRDPADITIPAAGSQRSDSVGSGSGSGTGGAGLDMVMAATVCTAGGARRGAGV